MRHVPVKSSAIESIAYSPEDEVLEIRFHTGRVYQYLDVPVERHDQLMAAESIGQCFNETIRDQYNFRELPPQKSTRR